jgi:four helix bundle protein
MSDIKQSNSIIARKSYAFALEIISIYKTLISDKKEFVLSKQLLRCGTSIGANVHEAISSESKRDFVHKLSIALKEAKETSYWLNLLRDSNYISDECFQKSNSSCSEIIKILNSIILTTKAKYFSKTTLNS